MSVLFFVHPPSSIFHPRFVLPQCVRDGLGELLAKLRVLNQSGLVGIRHKAAFNQNRRAILSAQNRVEPRMADTAIFNAGCARQCALDADSELEILRVKSVVGKNLRPDIRKTARQRGRHAGRRNAIGFKAAGLSIAIRRGIEMQADEQIRVMRFGKNDPVQVRHGYVAGARQKNFPAIGFEQRRETFCPVERELLFQPAVEDAVGADVGAAMAGVNHDDTIAKGQRRPKQQRLNVFLQIEAVDENLVQAASRLPISKAIVPFGELIAYAVTGVSDKRCGALILFSAAQRSSEVHVVTGAANDGWTVPYFVTGMNDRAAGNLLMALVSDQFNEDVPADRGGDEMVSSGMVGVEAHPARRTAAPTMMAAGLNIRSLCGC